jgi:sulfopyruvate decarboxylase subunit alpha
MDDAAAPTVEAAGRLSGARIIDAVKASRIDYVLSVPDIHTAKGLLWPISQDADLKLIRVCKEDETLGIAAGLLYGNLRSLILIQYTGFLYSINAIRGVAVGQKLPIVMMVGLLDKEPGVAPQNSTRYGISIMIPICEAMKIKYIVVETDADVPLIQPAIEAAYANSQPVAIFIGGKAQ